MDENEKKVKALVLNYYTVIRCTEYSEEDYKLMLFNLTYELMKLVNPEEDIPKEGLKPEWELE